MTPPNLVTGIGSNLHEVPKIAACSVIFFSCLIILIPLNPLVNSPPRIFSGSSPVSVGKNPIFWWTNPDSLGNLPIFNPNTISIGILELLHFCCWIVLDFLICRSFPLNSFIGVVFKPCVVLSKTAWLRTGFPQLLIAIFPKILVSISPYTLW